MHSLVNYINTCSSRIFTMYDVAILGGGPAGVTAAIYCARYKLKTIVISTEIGGWAKSANVIENMPSNPAIRGKDLVNNYKEQLKNNDIELKKETVTELEKENDTFLIKTKKGDYKAKYVIYCMGTKKKMLNVPGEDKFLGNGIHLCATCDAPFYDGEEVVVVGGNNSGASAAILLSEFATKVYLIEVMEELPMEPIWKERIEKNDKIEVMTSTSVKEFKGEEELTGVVISNGTELAVKGAFIEIGSDPNISILETLGAKIDEYKCVYVGSDQKTSIKGLYAAGDVTNNSNNLRQIVSAQGEGAVAANAVYKEILNE